MNSNEEDRVKTIFAALRHAEPRPGMEQRILARLQGAEQATGDGKRWLTLPRIAFACATAVLLSVGVWQGLARKVSLGEQRTGSANVVWNERGRSDLSGVRHRQAMDLSLADQTRRRNGDRAGISSLPRFSRVKNGSSVSEGHAADLGVAGDSAGTPSFPAPQEPLTDQERLLLRLAHRGDPVQLAALAPAAFEADFEREKEHVQEFFAEPPPVDQ